MALAKALLPEFEHEMATLRRVLERVPADRLDFRPHPKSFTLGDLANHAATIPGWTISSTGSPLRRATTKTARETPRMTNSE